MSPELRSPTVLYIGGSGRSGSTLVGRFLGSVPGVASAGELVFLWTRGLRNDESCGCGAAFSRCPFWQSVGDVAFGGWSAVNAFEMAALQRSVDRHRYVPLLMSTRRATSFRTRLDRYLGVLSRIYHGIAEVSGARLLVDASKHASTAYLVRRVPQVNFHLLHLVRDSRGVSHSWTRRVLRPEVREQNAYMPRCSPERAAAEWALDNTLLDFLRARVRRSSLVRYEDFVEAPQRTCLDVLGSSGLEVSAGDLDLVRDGRVHLAGDHSLSGNPMRFRSGPIPLQVDDAWRREMPVRSRRAVTMITSPWLHRYKYLPGHAAQPANSETGGEGRAARPV